MLLSTLIILFEILFPFQARKKVLQIYTRKMTLNECDLDLLASLTDMFTGADLESLCREVDVLVRILKTFFVNLKNNKYALHLTKEKKKISKNFDLHSKTFKNKRIYQY